MRGSKKNGGEGKEERGQVSGRAFGREGRESKKGVSVHWRKGRNTSEEGGGEKDRKGVRGKKKKVTRKKKARPVETKRMRSSRKKTN